MMLSLIDRSGAKTNREVAKELIRGRKYGVVALQNRWVGSLAAQDKLDEDRLQWKEIMIRRMDGSVDPSIIGDFDTLGNYKPKGLPPLIKGLTPRDPDFADLASRNAKHRNETATRTDLLRDAAKNIENKPD